MRLKIIFFLCVANVFCGGVDEDQPRSFVSQAYVVGDLNRPFIERCIRAELQDSLQGATIYGDNPVERINKMFDKSRNGFLFALGNDKQNIYLDILEKKYKSVEAILTKYGTEAQAEFDIDWDYLQEERHHLSHTEYHERYRMIRNKRDEAEKKILEPLLDPNSALSKWARYSEEYGPDSQYGTVRTLSKEFRNNMPKLPSLPALPEDPADLANGTFDKTMSDYADKVEAARTQATIALAQKSLRRRNIISL